MHQVHMRGLLWRSRDNCVRLRTFGVLSSVYIEQDDFVAATNSGNYQT